MNYSTNQNTIFDFVGTGTGNAIVKAVAGSGKTTTLVEAIKRIPAGKTSIFLSFGKAIATELSKRGVNAKTFHGLCIMPVKSYWGVKDINTDKIRDIIDNLLGDEDGRMYGPFLGKLVDIGRQIGIGCLVPDTTQAWDDIVEHHDLELESDNADYARALRLASEVLQISNTTRQVDFADMLYLAVKEGISLPRFDFVFVDEAQDTNAIQRAILRKIMKPSSRLVAVGDPAQAIYGFRGADSNSMNMIATEFDAIELPLTVSYRCPLSVVRHAKQWVSYIEAAEGAPEGSVTSQGADWKAEQFMAHDLIVCRTTAPLISMTYQLLAKRIPAYIMGKEIGTGLKSLIKKMNAKGVPALEVKLDAYFSREMEKAIAKKMDSKLAMLRDKRDCLSFLIHSMTQTNSTVPALNELIDSLFAEGVNKVALATIHKAKGLEADRVYWLNSSKCPSKWAKQAWQQEQERNLCYVATTRAKRELILIEEPETQPK